MNWSKLKVDASGLLPVVVQDAMTKQVIMLAYMDENAMEETMATGEMVYYSRSRKKRWKKGELSGNSQKLVSLSLDCDKDTLLAVVEQEGVGCHTGSFSCFDGGLMLKGSQVLPPPSEESVISRLEEIIEERKKKGSETSYTKYLFEKGLDKMLKKVGEETSEVIIAAKNNDQNELVYEVSDLMYHLLVTLNRQGVSWERIENSLEERFPAQLF